jgi:hypothetical protein
MGGHLSGIIISRMRSDESQDFSRRKGCFSGLLEKAVDLERKPLWIIVIKNIRDNRFPCSLGPQEGNTDPKSENEDLCIFSHLFFLMQGYRRNIQRKSEKIKQAKDCIFQKLAIFT